MALEPNRESLLDYLAKNPETLAVHVIVLWVGVDEEWIKEVTGLQEISPSVPLLKQINAQPNKDSRR